MTHNQQILKHLKKKNATITPMQALHWFKCWALSSRTSDLKKLGYNIDKEMITKGGKTFAKYYIK